MSSTTRCSTSRCSSRRSRAAASALPGLTYGGELLNQVIGELMLCVIASALAIYGRGYLAKEELPRRCGPSRPLSPTS